MGNAGRVQRRTSKYIHEVSFPKGYNLMGIDKVETSVYFVKKELSGPMYCRMVMKLPFGLEKKETP